MQIVSEYAVPDPDRAPSIPFETGSGEIKPSLELANPTFDTGAEPVPVFPRGGEFTRERAVPFEEQLYL